MPAAGPTPLRLGAAKSLRRRDLDTLGAPALASIEGVP
jgi:hypothetical protein